MVTSGVPAQREWVLDDADAVVTFYRAHVADVHRYLARLAGGDRARTEDLVQEVYVALARAVRSGQLPAAGPGWLMTTARFVFLHDERRGRREARRLQAVAAPRPSTTGPEHDLAVRDALQGLGDVDRAALVFRYVDDLPVAEVASLLGKGVEATESILVRARRRLRQQLEVGDDD
jgi:RNA polymerase sigma-70 factor (ECF subfamily)